MRVTWAFPLVGLTLMLSSGLALAAHAGVRYDDATAASGVSFRTAGALYSAVENEWPAFPEINGSGACIADFDGDGLPDLFLVNQRYNPMNPVGRGWAERADPTSKLYLNRGDGTFEDATARAGVAIRLFGYGCTAVDVDGDGDRDLFVTGFGASVLYRNDGDARFVNATAGSGVPTSCDGRACNSLSAAWADYDLDGDLDAYVANYVDTNLSDVRRGPNDHVAQWNWLLKNDGTGRFTNVAAAAGVAGRRQDVDGSKSMAVAWFDADLDGDSDLYVCNDEEPNEFYVNDGDGTFTDASESAGVANELASMGIATGDYDGDGYPDLYFTHFAGQENGFYRNRGNLTFEDRSGEDELSGGFHTVGWGTAFADADRDGDLDVLVVNGNTEWASPEMAQTAQLFTNGANLDPSADPWDRNWTDATLHAGPGITARRVARGAAFGDLDLDGDTDVVIVPNYNGTAEVVRASGASGRYLNVLLRDAGPNRDAIGARIVLEASGLRPQSREVQAGASYLSQNAIAAEFGLGAAARADRVTVHWPRGGTTVIEDVSANRTVLIDRAAGLRQDVLAPLTRPVVEGLAGSDGWWRSSIVVTLTVADRGAPVESGVAWTEFAVEDAAWAAYDGRRFTFGEGEHVLHAQSADGAGNVEPRRTHVLRVDATPPTATHALAGVAGDGGWWRGNVTVTLAGADDRSGLAEIRYRVDAGAWRGYDGAFTVSGDGAHVVEYEPSDRAGNAGAARAVAVAIDATPPAIAITSPDVGTVYLGARRIADLVTGPAHVIATPSLLGVGGPTFPAAADASDAVSGVARVVFLLNGQAVATDGAAPFGFAWDTRAYPSGLYLLDATAVDAAGNSAAARVRVSLVSGTPDGAARTAADGPSRATGIAPVDDAIAIDSRRWLP